MPTCRECKAQLSELVEVTCEYKDYRVTANNTMDALEREDIDIRGEETIHFECPECEEAIFSNYRDALAFLVQE